MHYLEIENRISIIRNTTVIIDKEVAKLYGVVTKRINEAVANNPDKFPEGYVFRLTAAEWDSLRSKNTTLKPEGRGKHTKFAPSVFTEKGLYMLATILKSSIATQTTIGIIETFSKLRELGKNIQTLSSLTDEKAKQPVLQKSGELIAEILEDDLRLSETETSIEINFAVLKFKHRIKRDKKDKK
jgi:hypothetical protein